MSAVRMCDRCGRIFPEGEEGSGIMSGTQIVKNERTGRKESVATQMDVCGRHNGFQTMEPNLGIESGKVVEG